MQKLLLGLLCLACIDAEACTNFNIKTKDNAQIIGRSLEFAQELPTEIKVFQRGMRMQSTMPDHQPAMHWTSKYGYVGMVFSPAKTVIDGFNEKGLSIGALWMPGSEYPAVPADPKTAMHFTDLSSWILGNFSTADEAKAALPNVQVFATEVPGLAGIPPIHMIVQDTSGKAFVVEFTKGKMEIYDNPLGVLTNAPEFPWHITNLRNFINLSAINAGPINLEGTVLRPTGQGSGLLGIPGDWTPPSRFVRATIFKQALKQPETAQQGVIAAFHVLNTVDIPNGTIRGEKNQDFDYTQWVVVKDLANKKLYVRKYHELMVTTLDLNKELK